MTKAKPLSERLIAYARKNPNGFLIKVEQGKIRQTKITINKNYLVDKTDNDNTRKIKSSFRNMKFTGYVSGYVDDKGNVVVNKNIITNKKEKAIQEARRFNTLSIYDLKKDELIQVQHHKGEYRKRQKKQLKENLETYQKKRKTDVVIKRGNKYYNTITKRYVSKSYAQRINTYFKRHPEASLHRATGHGIYSTKKSMTELPIDVKNTLYSGGTQIIKTKNLQGKTVYFSPIQDEYILEETFKGLKKLDYKIAGKKANVSLYRLTLDRKKVYHIIDWEINEKVTNDIGVNILYNRSMPIYNIIERELRKIAKKYKLGNGQNMYAHFSTIFFSRNKGYDTYGKEKGKVIGLVDTNESGFRILKDEFEDIFDYYRNQLEIDSYVYIFVKKVTFYIWNSKSFVDNDDVIKSKYRLGVNKMTQDE